MGRPLLTWAQVVIAICVVASMAIALVKLL